MWLNIIIVIHIGSYEIIFQVAHEITLFEPCDVPMLMVHLIPALRMTCNLGKLENMEFDDEMMEVKMSSSYFWTSFCNIRNK